MSGAAPARIVALGRPESRVHRLDPRAKLLAFAAVTAVAVSAPASRWPAYAACAAVLAAVAAAAGIGPGAIARRAAAVLPPVLLAAALLPFVHRGGASVEVGPLTASEAGLALLAGVAAKALIGTVSAILLAATTPFPLVLRALEWLRVPRLLTLAAAFTYRYLFVLADEVRRMRSAAAARGYRPRRPGDARAVGRLATALFLRAHGRGERVYLAMAARGYRGAMPELVALRARPADVAFAGAVAAGLVAVRVALEVAP